MTTYGQTIRWTNFDGSVEEITVSKCASAEEAYDMAIINAQVNGWTPPRWWQFWRWSDTSPIDPRKP